MILTNSRPPVQHTNVLPLRISDHDCVVCVRKINYTKFPHWTDTCRNYSKYNHSSLAKDIENTNWEPLYSSSDVNTCWYYLKELLSTKFDHYAPKIQKRVKGKPSPRLSFEIKTLLNTRDKILRKARKSRKKSVWSSSKKLRNQCNNKIKKIEAKLSQRFSMRK